MKDYAKVGMTTKELDDFGASILKKYNAQSAPYKTYGFLVILTELNGIWN